jgi:DNA-binding CsgD family transcriptional regulator
MRSLPQLVERAPLEVCHGCGFERAALFSVDGSVLVAESVYFERDRGWAEEFLELARSHRPQLSHSLVETEIVRRRVPVLVTDAQKDPRMIEPFVRATRTTSYVAAPVMPEGRVIGIIEADCYFSGRRLEALDRDTLWTFAEAFGYALERTVLLERLRSQQDNVNSLVATTMEAVAELSEAEVELSPGQQRAAGSGRPVGALSSALDPGITEPLTARELQVLRLMAAGSTNADVASRLVISANTVKSHVRHILRKLGAANRAEAVSRYLLARSGTVPAGRPMAAGPPSLAGRSPVPGNGEIGAPNSGNLRNGPEDGPR